MLDSALHALIGEQDQKFLKAAFVKMKKSPTLLKLDRPSKFAIVLDKFTSQCLEHLRTSDPELSSFTAFGLLSFITKGKFVLCMLYLFSNFCVFDYFVQLIKMKLSARRLLI